MATATRTARPISPAQIKFVKSLLDQRDVPAELVQAMGDWENEFTTRNASTTIDLLKSLPWAPKADEAPADELADEPGMYEVDGTIFHVKSNRSKTNVYAMELVGDEYVYAGSIRKNKITKAHRITIERARELSGLRGQCIRCLRTLSDPKSIERSMGKWCSDRI